MATQVQQRRGTTSEHSTFTGAVGEVTIDTDKDTAVVHDGSTAGGRPLLREDQSNLPTSAPANGVYIPSANNVAISTNGTGRLFVDASGRVGVGASPVFGADFEVRNPGTVSRLRVNSGTVSATSGSSDIDFVSAFSGSGVVGTARITGTAPAGGQSVLSFLTSPTGNSPQERLRITSDGKVGLGTSSPGAKLTIAQAATNADTDGIRIVDSGGSTRANLYYRGSQVFEINSASAPGGGDVETFRLSTAGNARLSITRDGKVGVGTTSPGTKLDVAGNVTVGRGAASGYQHLYFIDERENISGRFARISKNYDSPFDFKVYASTSNVAAPICFNTTLTSEAARIDSSRRLLVGTSTSRSNVIGSSGHIQLEKANGCIQTLVNNQASANDAQLLFGKTRGATIGANTVVNNGDALGLIAFGGADGANITQAAHIRAFVDGTPGANDMPGRLVFSTTADGASSPTERMRITSDAYVRLASGTGGIQFNGDTAAANALDDYEEGSWTLTLADAATGGNVSSSSKACLYTKIGNLVTVVGSIFNFSTAGLTAGNTLYFRGLPFAAGSENAVGSVTLEQVTFSGVVAPFIPATTNYFDLRSSTSAAGDIPLVVSAFASGSADLVSFAITYRV